jgi:hypothetical protein
MLLKCDNKDDAHLSMGLTTEYAENLDSCAGS